MNIKYLPRWNLLLVAAVVLTYVSQSPILRLYNSGAAVLYAAALYFSCIYFLAKKKYEKPIASFWVILSISLTTSAYSFYWQSFYRFSDTLFLISSIFVLCGVSKKELKKIVYFLTIVMGFLVIGAWVGILLKGIGVNPLGLIDNVRKGYEVYHTTLFTDWSFIPRSSGIYYEAGEFSFFICGLSACRRMFNMREDITWFLLVGGLVTFSLAHVVYIIFHVLSRESVISRLSAVAASTLVLALVVSVQVGPGPINWMMERFYLSDATNTLRIVQGDNRTQRFLNSIEFIRSRGNFMWGVGPDASQNLHLYTNISGPTDQNPLYPIVKHGLISSIPYYVALLLLMAAPIFGRKFIVVLGIGMLFTQRPWLISAGYATICAMVLLSVVYTK